MVVSLAVQLRQATSPPSRGTFGVSSAGPRLRNRWSHCPHEPPKSPKFQVSGLKQGVGRDSVEPLQSSKFSVSSLKRELALNLES